MNACAGCATCTHLTVRSISPLPAGSCDSKFRRACAGMRCAHSVACAHRAAAQSNQGVCGRRRATSIEPCRRTRKDETIGRQLLRAGTGVGANYRAACRPRSDADFVAKLGTVIEECDETAFWLEMMLEVRLTAAHQVNALLDGSRRTNPDFVASRETVRRRLRQNKRFNQA